MTPLAHRLAKNAINHPKPGWDKDLKKSVRWLLEDTHFFECTAITKSSVLGDMAGVLRDVETVGGYTAPYRFLPANKTWLEIADDEGGRFALFCVTDDGAEDAVVFRVQEETEVVRTTALGRLFFEDGRVEIITSESDPDHIKQSKRANPGPYAQLARDAIRLCVLINLPHVLRRKQNIAHKGAARKLGLAVGRFPLHGWTELSLDVHLAPKKDDGAVHEAGFTGGKCLHFCRAHLRLQNEKLVVVKSHWRGDPALGIKRTRYKMQAPKHEHAG